MGLGDLSQRYPRATAVAAAILLVFCVGLIITRVKGRSHVNTPREAVYYVDLNTRELVTDREQTPPINTASGASAVRAHVFTCGSCDNDTFIAYMETYTDDAKQAMEKIKGLRDPVAYDALSARIEAGHLVAMFDPQSEPNWVPESSSPGRQIMRSFSSKCDKPIECLPK